MFRDFPYTPHPHTCINCLMIDIILQSDTFVKNDRLTSTHHYKQKSIDVHCSYYTFYGSGPQPFWYHQLFVEEAGRGHGRVDGEGMGMGETGGRAQVSLLAPLVEQRWISGELHSLTVDGGGRDRGQTWSSGELCCGPRGWGPLFYGLDECIMASINH